MKTTGSGEDPETRPATVRLQYDITEDEFCIQINFF